jgi:hypothetical protein
MTAADSIGPICARELIGSHDVLLMTLDTLRYDVAQAAVEAGQTPTFARLLPGGRWEWRHSPATFTYAAHHAFFAGFLPTPASPGNHPRLFAARFAGSATTTDATCVLDAPDIVTGLAGHGYHTICIGGVGFFNKQTPLGSVLPGLFAESHWDETLGVASAISTERQVALAVERIEALSEGRRLFLFLNISAIHQPNRLFLPGATGDTPASMAAALAYVDRHMAALFDALTRRTPLLAVICADRQHQLGIGHVPHDRVGDAMPVEPRLAVGRAVIFLYPLCVRPLTGLMGKARAVPGPDIRLELSARGETALSQQALSRSTCAASAAQDRANRSTRVITHERTVLLVLAAAPARRRRSCTIRASMPSVVPASGRSSLPTSRARPRASAALTSACCCRRRIAGAHISCGNCSRQPAYPAIATATLSAPTCSMTCPSSGCLWKPGLPITTRPACA